MRLLLALLLIALAVSCDRFFTTPPTATPAPATKAKPKEPTESFEGTTLPEELVLPGPGAPAWARGLIGHHPQPGKPKALFEEAKAPLQGDRLEKILLLFEVKVTGKLDDYRAPDLKLVLERVGAPRIAHDEPDDRAIAYLALSLPSLALGDAFALRVYDRDLTVLERVGATKLSYAGELPLRSVEKLMTVELRALPRARVEVLLGERLRELGEALAKVVAPAPKPLREDLGLAESPIPKLRARLLDAAALGGWTDPRIKAAREKTERVERRFDEAVKRALAEAAASLPARGASVETAVPLKLRVASLACACAATAPAEHCCSLTLEVENHGGEPVECHVPVSWIGKLTRFHLIDAEGVYQLRLASCSLAGAASKGSIQIPPGAKAQAVLHVDLRRANGRVPGKPALLRVGAGFLDQSARLLRLD